MGNFGRALRLALQYRFTFMASVVCALLVGVLWGGNISAVYPLVEIAFQGKSLQHWVDGKIGEANRSIAEKTEETRRLEKQLAEAAEKDRGKIETQLSLAQSRVAAEQEALGWYQSLKPYIERYLPNDPFLTLALILLGLLVATAVKEVFLVGHTVLVARLAELGTFELRKEFFRRTLDMDVNTFSAEGTSQLMSRFTHDMAALSWGMNALFGKLVREPLKMAACLIGAALICWRLLVLSLVVAPVAAWAIRRLAKTLKRANRRAMEEMAQLYNTLDESFRGIKIVKAFTMERQERKRFHKNSKEYYRKAMKIARYDSLTSPLTEIMGIITICLAVLAGAWLVLEGETHLLGIRMSNRPLDIGSLLVFFGLLAGVADPSRKLSDVYTRIQAGSAAADRIYAMLDREPEVRDPQCPRPLARHTRDLVFERVGFAYGPGRAPVLHNVDLKIAFGESIAIVGPSGGGKTTLASLVPRFADPTTGEIRLDGIPLKELRIRDLRKQVGLVTQDPLLFDDTVLNNIRYGSPHATVEQVKEAARQAYAHQFIERELSEGYETVVGPMGGRLSGGQRQRIALARAILRDPAILILDEATSQIDLQSEQIIQKVLERFIQGRTTIMVTHRMSLIAMADRVVVMQDGRILDFGTHDQLLARCPLYQRLHQIQYEDLKESA
ncbi:MAG: ABC transporter ATP-binding protein [Pirellulales bacterium]|nr:ABC transporter ATP-binding protein [Pirellulales bacterium]